MALLHRMNAGSNFLKRRRAKSGSSVQQHALYFRPESKTLVADEGAILPKQDQLVVLLTHFGNEGQGYHKSECNLAWWRFWN